jgi:hypothetical protein
MQIGYRKELWPLVLIKELIDNAIDECEKAETGAIEIAVELDKDSITVSDNGSGIPAKVIRGVLDYTVRVSDKKYYIAPTRGQLGNALKCVIAAPFVATDDKSVIEVVARGLRHRIEVYADRIAQKPKITHTTTKEPTQIGTIIKIYWPQVASCYNSIWYDDLYRLYTLNEAIAALIEDYAAFNPHVSFTFNKVRRPATALDWQKWRTDALTSAHWYGPDELRDLIAAYINERDLPVRDFVETFAGLTRNRVRADVLAAARIKGSHLSDLVRDDDVDMAAIKGLLRAMQRHSKPVIPKRLGVIGQDHLSRYFESLGAKEFKYYKKAFINDDELPVVLEIAFAVKPDSSENWRRIIGLNWSPVFKIPSGPIEQAISRCLINSNDPVILLIHVACPRLEFTEHGKGAIAWNPSEVLSDGLKKVTRDFTREKMKAHGRKEERISQWQLDRLENKKTGAQLKAAAYEVIPQAYALVSDDGRLPANARQMLYAVRPPILVATGGKFWKDSATFTQGVLQDYLNDNPETTADWDIVFDARGHFTEPHMLRRFGCGTLEVRSYINSWGYDGLNSHIAIGEMFPTSGPRNRYKFALFIEKEGFDPLLARARIAERYDLAIFSTKGMSVTAARKLVDELSAVGVTILIVHDFDLAALSIAHWLWHDNERYTFQHKPRVIDLGLRLADVKKLELESEEQIHHQRKDPTEKFLEWDDDPVTKEETDFLRGTFSHDKGGWVGRRAELNAIPTSQKFIDWLEKKLKQVGVKKVVPDKKTLAVAWNRALKIAKARKIIAQQKSTKQRL